MWAANDSLHYEQHIVANLKNLEEDVQFVHNGTLKKLPVILFTISGDDLGLHEILGLKSKYQGDKICRMCLISSKDFKDIIYLADTERKTKQWHEEVIADKSLWNENNIVDKCPFNEYQFYHFCNAPVADIMHNVLEGHACYLIGKVLTDIVAGESYILKMVNAGINDLLLKGAEGRNPPPPLVKKIYLDDIGGLIGLTAANNVKFY